MKVEVRDPRITPDVRVFVERLGFAADAVSEDAIDVRPPDGVPEHAARLKLDLYLALWRAVHERHDVTLLP